LLVTVAGPQGSSVIPLARPLARIGREPGSDIVLDSPWVARRSLYLHATDEGVFCFYLQPEETQSRRLGFWLAPGEPLLVGPYRISACLEGDEPGPAPALVPMDDRGSAAPPYPMFQVYSEGKLRAKRRFRARLNLIGRRHECALQIMGKEVSSFHGCLYWQYPRLWYVDLVSSNGTGCNGQRIDCSEVRIGDRLEVGEFTLLYQRLSKGGAGRSEARNSLPAAQHSAVMLPPDFDEDLPLEQDGPSAINLGEAQARDVACSSTVIPQDQSGVPLTMTTQHGTGPEPTDPAPEAARRAGHAHPLPPAEIDRVLADPAGVTMAAGLNETAPAPIQHMRQELAMLQRRVEELTQVAAQAVENAAQQMTVQTREVLAHERQCIAQELERRAGDLAAEKLALEARWQTISGELATQVGLLRDEAALLARQRQAMEQSRLLWDAQRSELERQLRAYARQLQRLEHGAALALPAPTAAMVHGPAGANGSKPSASLPLAATRTYSLSGLPPGNGALESETSKAPLLAALPSGSLMSRSQVVDARVAGAEREPVTLAALSSGDRIPPGLGGPWADEPSAAATDHVLEGSLGSAAAAPAAAASDHSAPQQTAAARRTFRSRKASQGKEAFDLVTNRLVEMEQRRRRVMVALGIAGTLAAVALASAMIVAAVLLR
jgi:pSer/pThr/pTyr-binding forkhead associated (FHA) protein